MAGESWIPGCSRTSYGRVLGKVLHPSPKRVYTLYRTTRGQYVVLKLFRKLIVAKCFLFSRFGRSSAYCRLVSPPYLYRFCFLSFFMLYSCYYYFFCTNLSTCFVRVGDYDNTPPSPSGRGGGIIDSFPSISFSFFKYIFCSFLH